MVEQENTVLTSSHNYLEISTKLRKNHHWELPEA